MKGTKRFGVSDSNPETNDSIFQSKRIMVGGQFDIHRAEHSLQQSPPPLDMRQAESSRQHVRALNTQFASWVQTQLQNHPDELWGDGIQDYLTHASNIMEKFSDVVNWLKAKSAKAENLSALGSQTSQKKLISESKDNEIKSLLDKPGIPPAGQTSGFAMSLGNPIQKKLVSESTDNEIRTFPIPEKPGIAPAGTSAGFGITWGSPFQKKPDAENKNNEIKTFSEKPGITPAATTTTTGFAMSWNSGLLFSSQTPFSFGSQSSIPVSHDVSNDADGEDDVEQPSSPSVQKTEEMGVTVVHEMKCKLYVKSNDPDDKEVWKDKGTGQLSIKCKEGVSKGTKESKPTILVRNDVGKVLLNALLYPGIKTTMQKNSIVAIFHTSDDGGGDDGGGNDSVVARTFLIRAKTEENRNKLASVIQEYAPTA